MAPADGTLYHTSAQIPDHRHRRGRSHSLASLLTFAATAMPWGAKGLYAIARWGRDYNHLAPLPGSTRLRPGGGYRAPWVSEPHAVSTDLDVTRFETTLTAWVRAAGFDDLEGRVVQLDGKRPRGRQGHQLPAAPLPAVYGSDPRAVVAQLAVADTNGHKTAPEVPNLLPLGGLIVTAGAAFTQRDVCEVTVGGGGRYVLPVKGNRPALQRDIAAGFGRAFSPDRANGAAGGGPHLQDPRGEARAGGDSPPPRHDPTE
jgi:hypothetical protein